MAELARRARVVVIGGGFGGLHVARSLRRAAVDLTVIDRRNFHLFQPLLYQVATGGLSPANIAAPLRSLLRRQQNASVLLGEVTGFTPATRQLTVHCREPGELAVRPLTVDYDHLVVAAGSAPSYFGNNQWAELAPALKTVEDATRIRARVFAAFEAAEHETDPRRQAELMTFVIVGAGPTGVELAGAISELAHRTLRDDFRGIDPEDSRIVLVDAADRVLSGFSPYLSRRAEQALRRLAVEIQTNTLVKSVADHRVELLCGGVASVIQSRTILWAAGVCGAPLGRVLADATGATLDRQGRVAVTENLTIDGHPEIFVIGDLARFTNLLEQPLPGVAPVAIQQGRYVGRWIAAHQRGRAAPPPFKYRDKGNMATIGRRAAVAQIGRFEFGGYLAWLLWLFVHIMSIAQFQNRVLVFLQWAWNYITFNRSARLITERDPP